MKATALLLLCLVLLACEPPAGPPPQVPAKPAPTTAVTPPEDRTVQRPPQPTDADATRQPPDAPRNPKPLALSEDEWKKRLTPQQYHVLRQKGTERAFTGEYDEHFQPGAYACAACGQVLFTSDTKFNSGCGWPAFYAAKAADRVNLHQDFSFGTVRTEVTCAKCGGHLGHVFNDAPQTPTGERFCINSVSLKFIPKQGDARQDKSDTPAP